LIVCSLCGVLSEGTWAERDPGADGGPRSRHARARDRLHRVQVLNRVLDHFGLRVQDWENATYVLHDAKGRQVLIEDLGGLWSAAERLVGRPLDPLDPGLVAALRRPA
jgi:hypothetical protein